MFQRTIDRVLAGVLRKCVMVYIDDIVIYNRSKAEHLLHLQLVFDGLHKAGLRLKPTKCFFGLPSVKLLGYSVTAEGISADPDKSYHGITTPPSERNTFVSGNDWILQTVPTKLRCCRRATRSIEKKTFNFFIGIISAACF